MDQNWSNLEFRVGPEVVQGGPEVVQGGPEVVSLSLSLSLTVKSVRLSQLVHGEI